MLVAIDKFGRLVLPKCMRDDLGLRAGDRLEAVEEEDRIVLRPAGDEQPVKVEDGVLVFSGRATGDLSRTLAEVRRERVDGRVSDAETLS